MTELICPTPEFVFNPDCGWWGACIRCHRFAWSHEQADPLADMRNAALGIHAAPVMRTVPLD